MHIFRIPGIFPMLLPKWKWQGNKKEKVVYLTFDDGPHPEITPWVIEELSAYRAGATFFLIGENAEKYPDLIRLLEENGHKIGNHTLNHLKGWENPDDYYIENVIKASATLSGKLFRPPYGRIRLTQAKKLRNLGFEIVMWSLLSCDYDPKLNREKSLKKLIQNTRNGSIVVFHDSDKAFENLKFILQPYLEFLKNNGFEMKTLS
ncbi:MAG: polysaccharide deacetylase family protein [Bacteroidetes bacterium]|nr:polysaccharide deacetylase family protein [Bacteroidota bacterium]